MSSYFELCHKLGKDITPPGGTDVFLYFFLENYLQNRELSYSYLDVASNSGVLSRKLAEFDTHHEILGIDINSAVVEQANKLVEKQQLKNIRFECHDATRVDLPKNHFDYINLGISVGFFIKDREACLKRCAEALKDDGVIFTSSMFYKKQPEAELVKQLNDALEINMIPGDSYDYKYHQEYMNKHFVLDAEIEVELSGNHSEEDYYNFITKHVDSTDAPVNDASKDEKEALLKEFARVRSMLNDNDQLCNVIIQGWRKKA